MEQRINDVPKINLKRDEDLNTTRLYAKLKADEIKYKNLLDSQSRHIKYLNSLIHILEDDIKDLKKPFYKKLFKYGAKN